MRRQLSSVVASSVLLALYITVILGVFAQRSPLVFRMADRLVSLCVFLFMADQHSRGVRTPVSFYGRACRPAP